MKSIKEIIERQKELSLKWLELLNEYNSIEKNNNNPDFRSLLTLMSETAAALEIIDWILDYETYDEGKN